MIVKYVTYLGRSYKYRPETEQSAREVKDYLKEVSRDHSSEEASVMGVERRIESLGC